MAQLQRHKMSNRPLGKATQEADHNLVHKQARKTPACQQNRKIVLAAVKQHGPSLQYAAECYKCDAEIVLASSAQDPKSLLHAAWRCRSDPSIMLAALRQDWSAVEYAAECCKSDVGIVSAALAQDLDGISYASKSCQNDCALMLSVVSQHGLALQHAAEC
eukprot:3568076-Amphidinium_carterae.2